MDMKINKFKEIRKYFALKQVMFEDKEIRCESIATG